MIKTIENFCKEKRLRFGYGNTEYSANEFFEDGGGVFLLERRPHVGYTYATVITRNIGDEDFRELVRRLRVNGSEAIADGRRIQCRFRPARPFTSGGAGIQNPTPPPPTKPSVTTGEITEVTSNSATFTATIENPDGVEITAKGFKYHKGAGAWVDVSVEGDNFTAQVTGLDSNSNYSYRAYIVVGSETIQGDIVSFHTAELTERETPFYITNKNQDAVNIELLNTGDIQRTFEISRDGIEWTELELPWVAELLQPNERLYIRNVSNNSNKLSFSENKYYYFTSNGSGHEFGCGGNILSLVRRDFENMDEVGNGCFAKLFSSAHFWEFPKLYFSNAPEMCFLKMYGNYPCASSVVELPAETVGKQAYEELFFNDGFKLGIDNIRIVLKARDISASRSLNNWIKATRPGQTGTVVCYPELELPALPSGWTREDLVD